MADSVSSGDSNDGLVIVGTTPASSEKVATVPACYESDLDEDEELVAVTAIGLARPTAEGAPVLATGATTWYKWPKPTEIFKGNPDEKLYAIVKQALANTPWSSKSQTKAWDEIAANLSTYYPDIFTVRISGIQAHLKFKIILKETKNWSLAAPFRSGGDNETKNSFMQACEEVLELYETWKALEGGKIVATAALKEKDKKDAEVMRRASVGSLTRDEI
jgi:hypothetical protein